MVNERMILKKPRCGWMKYLVWLLMIACIVGAVMSLVYIRHHSINNPISELPSRPELKPEDYQYGVMVDAGSSGSRVYLYKWPPGNSDGLLRIEQMKNNKGEILVMKTSPGISAYEDNPFAAYQSLKPLLLYASLNIPKTKHKETPLYILCTAGMRLLTEEKRNNIINSVSSKIQQNFDFFFQSSHIEVIDGRMEGVYGWIAVNYMLGKFDHDFFTKPNRQSTVGALDMGGASTQITYEVPKNAEIPADLVMDIDLGCHAHDTDHKSHTYRLYTTSFLGLGANEARKRYVDLLMNENKVDENHGVHTITDPCLPKGMQETQSSHLFHHVTFQGTGNFTACRLKLYPLLNIPTTCPQSPCSMNGVFQPPINFYNQEMYGFSEYWYTMDDILRIGGIYREEKFIKGATEFCATEWSVLSDRFKSGEFPNADQHRFQYQCFKSAWVLAVLHDGHHFPSNYQKFISAKTVNNEVIQWTYGAMIYRTRYLPLRDEGVDKMLSRSHSKADVILYYAPAFCFVVVLLAIIFWLHKIRRIRSSSYVLPSTFQDIQDDYPTKSIKELHHTNSLINFTNVCVAPQQTARLGAAGLLPRTFSDSLLNRDMATVRVPIVLGD